MPILYTNADAELIGFSTPCGLRKTFYTWCVESPQYKEFHYDYTVLPWAHIIEAEKSSYTEEQWEHEFLALFGSSDSGVYKPSYIDRALHDYSYESNTPTPGWVYSIGADWNEKHGAEITVLGYSAYKQKFQIMEIVHVTGSDFTQLNSVSKLIEINKKWNPRFVYVDSGNGATNAELIMKTAQTHAYKGGDNATANLLHTLKKYDSGASLLIEDTVTHEKVKKQAKSFMVNSCVRLFEQNRIEISSHDSILEKQLRNYIIERITPTGNPVYGLEDSRVGDHRLDSFNLAVVAFQLEFEDLFKQKFSMEAMAVPDPRRLVDPTEEGGSGVVERPAPRDLSPIKNKLEEQVFRLPAGNLNDPMQGIKTNRPGWATDEEHIYIEKFLQKRYARNRQSRLGQSRPRRSNI